MISGLSQFMERKGYSSIEDFRGRAVPKVTDWQYLNLNYVVKAEINQDLCIKCGRCHIACEDTSHQAIFAAGRRRAEVRRQRRRMRRLQSLRARLPGRELHHAGSQDRGRRSAHGARLHAPAAQLDAASEQSGRCAGGGVADRARAGASRPQIGRLRSASEARSRLDFAGIGVYALNSWSPRWTYRPVWAAFAMRPARRRGR